MFVKTIFRGIVDFVGSNFQRQPDFTETRFDKTTPIFFPNPEHTITRSIEFPPEYHQAGVSILNFTDDQIETFVKNWFAKEPEKITPCIEELRQKPQIKEMASNPLLLTLLCLSFGENMEFPPNRAELYGDAINALLRKWNISRGIKRDEIYKNLSLKRKEGMFGRIAAETFEDSEYFIPERRLTKQIENYIQHLPRVDSERIEPDSMVILKAIEAQHGIFVERAKGIHSFAHLTFQEYFH